MNAKIIEVMKLTLGVTEIDDTDDFLSLGGDSMSAAQLSFRLQSGEPGKTAQQTATHTTNNTSLSTELGTHTQKTTQQTGNTSQHRNTCTHTHTHNTVLLSVRAWPRAASVTATAGDTTHRDRPPHANRECRHLPPRSQ